MNDLEELFNRQPPLSEADLSRIITYMREQRAQSESGLKAAKAKVEKAAAVDLASLGLSQKKAPVGIKLGGK
jgi:hypothetical protein